MSSYTQTAHHLVFSTKRRLPVLAKPGRDSLYRYTHGILENKKCHVYRIGGVEDHIHILTSIHPSIALAASNSTNATWSEEGRGCMR